MPKKCESCRHYQKSPFSDNFAHGLCTNLALIQRGMIIPLSINYAREICDKEGNGIFVYFEPKIPATGRAFAKAVAA